MVTWLSWGFGEKEIQLAYEKTCMNTGGLKWPYLNSILKSWHEQASRRSRRSTRATAQPAKAAKPGYGVQRHGDKLTELEREAIARMMQEED